MKYFLILSLFICTMTASAQPAVDRVVLKDGSVVTGFIAKQIPGKQIDFYSTCADIKVDGSFVSTPTNRKLPKNKWPEDWKEYAQDQDTSYLSKEFIQLSDLALESNKLDSTMLISQLQNKRNVQILERGEFYTIRSVSRQSFSINIKEIDKIERIYDESEKNLDKLIDRNGIDYVGSIEYSVPNKSMHLSNNDGESYDIKFSDILREIKLIDNIEQPISERIKYLDIINRKSGDVLRGLITVKFYGTEKEPPYIVITDCSGLEETQVRMKDIVEIRKESNPDYRPIEKADTTIMINENKYSFSDFGLCYNTQSKDSCLSIERNIEIPVMVLSSEEGKRLAKISLPREAKEDEFVLLKSLYGKYTTEKKDSFKPCNYGADMDIYWFDINNSDKTTCVGKSVVDKETGIITIEYELEMRELYILRRKTDNKCIPIKTN